jgi:hypothetical protein
MLRQVARPALTVRDQAIQIHRRRETGVQIIHRREEDKTNSQLK